MASQDEDSGGSSGSPPPSSSPPSAPPRFDYQDIPTSELIATPAFQDWINQPFVGEIDPILSSFGTPGEALQADISELPINLDRLRERYQRRLDLAALARFPEGYNFVNRIDENQWTVILLSPPNRVAVQHQDGTWARRQRQAQDGPAPYTQQWYFTYLRNNGLPGYFLNSDHIACHEDNSEAQLLDVPNTSSLQPPPPRYLEFRYPVSPESPTPDIFQDGKPYVYNLTNDERLKVARHFPATNAISSDTNYRVYVLPSGHIFIRYGQPDAGTNVLPSGTMSWQTSTTGSQLASYRIEAATTSQSPLSASPAATSANVNTPPPQRSNNQTTALIAEAEDDGGFPRLGQRPQGLGQWRWLEEGVDDVRAREMGFASQEDVEIARQDGLLTHGTGINAGPLTVWYPDPNFFNPIVQPQGPGHWAFHTIGDGSDREHAITQFGNQEDRGLLGNDTPSARDIWRLRQREQAQLANGESEADRTDEVNLVWIPGEPDPDDIIRHSETPETGSSQGSETHRGHAIGNVDPNSGQNHDPQNRGENDQTGGGNSQYHTRIIDGKKFTLDRSRLYPNSPEPRKTWIVTKKGQWQQYPNYAELDWSIKESVTKLNNWKETALGRNKWPKKRVYARETYSDGERAWLFKHVKAAHGKRPTQSIPRLTADFNQAFPDTQRDETGIQGVVDRLRKEYAEYGGEMKERHARGQNKKEEKAERKRRQREQSEDSGEESSRKKGRRDQGEDDDDEDYEE